MVSRWWWDLTTVDFAGLDRERTVAVLPVGAVEQHGPHLPVGVDAAINAGIVARAVELLPQSCPALVLPMTPVGKSDEHLSFPGTLTLSHETLGRVWYELGASVHRAGLRKILFFNSHGGQPQVAEIVCRDLRVKLGMFAASAMWPQLIDMTDLFDAAEIKHGIHGGDIETSLMLAAKPDTVHMDRAPNAVPATIAMSQEFKWLGAYRPAGFAWMTQDINPSGAVGDATLATAAKGDAAFARGAEAFVELLREIDRFDLSRLREGPLTAK